MQKSLRWNRLFQIGHDLGVDPRPCRCIKRIGRHEDHQLWVVSDSRTDRPSRRGIRRSRRTIPTSSCCSRPSAASPSLATATE